MKYKPQDPNQEKAESAMKNGIASTSKQLGLKQTIIMLVNAMKADYGQRFKNAFSDDESLRLFKNRLLEKLRPFRLDAIVNGYELFIEQNPDYVPTIPQLVDRIANEHRQLNKSDEENQQAEKLASLPPPTHECNPIEMLANVKPGKKTKAELLAEHEALINIHNSQGKIRHNNFSDKPEHQAGRMCAFLACQNAGSISHGMVGGGNFYCREHFRKY